MNTRDSESTSKTPSVTWPSWLDGRTLAILAALLTLGTMMQTTHLRLSADIEKVRDDLGGDIEKLRDDLSARIEKVRDDLGAEIGALDDRLRTVEIDVAAIRTAVIGLDTRTGAAKRSGHVDTTETGEREG